MNKRLHFTIILLLLLGTNSFFGQTTAYKSEVFGAMSTGENTPFWMLNQTWGVVPLKSNNFYVRGAVFHDREINNDWKYNLGFDMTGSSPHSFGTVWVQQAYGELDWKKWRLNIGSKEDYMSLLDPSLSSGDFSLSNNARPAPEFKISLSDFILVPYTKGKLYIRGHFAIGKFSDGNCQEDTAKPNNHPYVKKALSHHKSFFIRFGNFENGNKFRFTGGVDHYAQWGGDRYSEDNVVKNPRKFSDFVRTFFAGKGGTGAAEGDQLYASGSHVGSYTFKLDYQTKDKDELSVYWHKFFEDGSGISFQSYRDMLLGFQYKRKEKSIISNILFEYIYTKQQTGPIHFNLNMDNEHSGIRNNGNGEDDYYNNYDQVQGRSYYGRSLGSPLLLSPEYNRDGRLHFKSNRIVAFHLALEGYLANNLYYRLMLTRGETWGRYKVPYINTKKGLASVLDINYGLPKMKDCNIKLSLGQDWGEYFQGDSFGVGLSFIKKGIVKSH